MFRGWRRKVKRGSKTDVERDVEIVGGEAALASTSNGGSRLSNKTDQKLKETRPLGLKLLTEGENPIVDIIAIHGLNGHREDTWTAKNGVNWLEHNKMLPSNIPNARIYAWGYDANTYSKTPLTAMYLYNHAEKLLSDLSLKRRLTKTERRPIIFIAHSLGGIVVKSALIHSSMAHSGHLKEHSAIKTSTYGIIFMGTPHQGGEGVSWGQTLASIGSVFINTDDKLLNVLEKDSEALQTQLAQYAPISGHFVTKFAYETYPMRIAKLGQMIIVPKSSAVVPSAVNVESIAIMADHKNMVKFSSETDEDYQTISGHLMLMVKDAPEKVAWNWEQEGVVQNALLGIIKPEFHVPFDMKGIPKTNAFVGRESYLDMMVQQLSPASARGRRICVLHGLGGIGKTQLAIEYARLHKNEYSSFFWLDGKTEETLIQSLMSIATRIPEAPILGFDICESSGIEEAKKKAQAVLRWFALEGNSRWLLVYDNIDKTSYGASGTDEESQASYNIEEYLPGGDAGAIIITTRLQRLVSLGEHVHVRKIDILNGVLILEKRSGKSLRLQGSLEESKERTNDLKAIDPDALALVRRLEGLPLALVLAGSYISRTTVSKYLNLYTTSWNSLHENLSFPPDYPGRTIITTWKISYDELKRKDEGATKLLQLCAYLDNKDVWYELFRWPQWGFQAPDWLLQIVATEITFLNAVNILLDYSLVEQNDGIAGYSMHAVVHDWIRETVNRDDDGMLLKLAVATVGLLADSALDMQEQDGWALERRILPHAARISQCSLEKAFIRHNPSDECKRRNILLNGLRGLSAIFDRCCMFAEAESIYQRLLIEEEKICGVESESALTTIHKLANLYSDQGKYREAEIAYRRALEGNETTLGPEHIDTLGAFHGLAYVLRLQGRPMEANAVYERGLVGKEEFCAKNDPPISDLAVRSKIAVLYSVQGRTTESHDIHKGVLMEREKLSGKEHPDTLMAARLLGIFYETQFRYDEAEVQFQRVLTCREKIFGKEHRLTLEALNTLGSMYKLMNRFGEGEEILQQVLKGREKLLGKDHVDTLDTLADLGMTYFLQEKWADAEPHYQRAVAGAEKVLGKEHVDTLAYMHNLGQIYAQLGKRSEAEAAYMRVLSVRKKLFDEEHELILDVFHDLGVLYVAQGREAEAEDFLYRAWTGREKVMGAEHDETYESVVNLYNLWLSQGRYSKEKHSIVSRILSRSPLSWVLWKKRRT